MAWGTPTDAKTLIELVVGVSDDAGRREAVA